MTSLEIKELDTGKIEARGFVLEATPGDWILYPEPNLESCCQNGDLQKGLHLSGDVPKTCKGKCVTVQGEMRGQKELSISSTTMGGLSIWPLLAAIFVVVLYVRYRAA